MPRLERSLGPPTLPVASVSVIDLRRLRDDATYLSGALRTGGVFCLYGPFRAGGVFNTPSNSDFDQSLKRRDPAMGIRDIKTLDDFAAASGLRRVRFYAVPSNNNVAVYLKAGNT